MILVVHGGAGDKKPTQKALKKLSESLSAGYVNEKGVIANISEI